MGNEKKGKTNSNENLNNRNSPDESSYNNVMQAIKKTREKNELKMDLKNLDLTDERLKPLVENYIKSMGPVEYLEEKSNKEELDKSIKKVMQAKEKGIIKKEIKWSPSFLPKVDSSESPEEVKPDNDLKI